MNRAETLTQLTRLCNLNRDGVAPPAIEASDFPELDALLPGGGWQSGTIVELMPAETGIGELRLLMPALARITQADRYIAMISPPYIPFAPALSRHGIQLERLLIIRAQKAEDTLWAFEQTLRCKSFGAVLAWPIAVKDREVRRLQLAAEAGRSTGFLYRPPAAALEASPAALRLQLRAHPDGRLELVILKCRGGRSGVSVRIRRESEWRVADGQIVTCKSVRRSLRHPGIHTIRYPPSAIPFLPIMLWLCISLPQLPLEALQAADADAAVVVTACEGSTRWIICCNAAAERSNLQAPMNYTVALAIHPQVTMLNRRPQAEQSALERLAAWAYQFSSAVILSEIPDGLHLSRTACLWLEIGASLTLFGGFRKFIEHLEAELQRLHYTYQLGIAPTLEGAALLARSGIRVAITNPHALFARIRNLPITRLALVPEITGQLHTSGVRTIGVLLELPRDAVAKRFGPETSNFLARIMGEAADPRAAFRLPEKYAAHFEFEFEVRSAEALLFPVRRMLYEFAGYLRARDSGVQRFVITFGHRQAPATEIRIGSSTPDRNAERFFSLVRERLEHIDLPAPTILLSVSADEFATPTALQPDLLSRALQQTEELSHTIDRIAARLGDENIHGLKSIADHRPEASWASGEPDEKFPNFHSPERPLWLLPEPRSLELSAIPRITSGPERIEAGWWDDSDVQRDYYIVRMSTGPDLWVFRDLRDSNWYLHGFWS